MTTKTHSIAKENRPYILPEKRWRNQKRRFLEKKYTVEAINEAAVENRFEYERGYSHIRLEYLAIHFLANQWGLSAPAFRQMAKPVGRKDYTEEEELIARDRQLIDFHYLFFNHKAQLSCGNDYYEAILGHDVTDFNFDRMAEQVMARGSATTKAVRFLAIPDGIQLELNVLRSDDTRKKDSTCRDKRQTIIKRINEEQRKPLSRLSESKSAAIKGDVWPLLLANGSPSAAVRYKGLMTSIRYEGNELKKEARRITDSKRWLMSGRVGKLPW
jgi:hypothetical protein